MKKTSLLFIIIALFFMADYDAYSQKKTFTKKKRWSVEFLAGMKSFTENNMDHIDTGFEGAMKVEKRGYGRFGFSGTLGYTSYPEYSKRISYNNEIINAGYTISDLNLGIGFTWYIMSVDLGKDFTPFLSVEFSNTFFRFVFSDSMIDENGEKEKDEYIITQSICPIFGVSYPLSESFTATARAKYTIHSFGQADSGSGLAFDYNSLSLNLGIMILIR